MRCRIVVTGMGVCSPIGMDVPSSAERLFENVSGLRQVLGARPGSSAWAGLVERLEPSRDLHAGIDRTAQLAIVAAEEARRDAGLLLEGNDPVAQTTGLVLGTSHGGRSQLDRFVDEGSDVEREATAEQLLLHAAHHHQSDAVAKKLGVRGPVATISSACSSSAGAIAHACDLLASGRARAVIAGGADAYSKLTAAGFAALKAVAEGPCSPFSVRIGLSLGEGAGFVVLERLEDARARNARIHAEVFGCGLSWDAYHITEPHPTGAGLLRAAESALAVAGVSVDEIDYVHAHGTGTRANDRAETLALKRLFGERRRPAAASSTKSFTGHTLGASAVLGLIFSILAMKRGCVPATLNFEASRTACDLDYVPNRCRATSIRRFLVEASGFGGTNGVVVAGDVAAEHRPRERRAGSVAITGVGFVSPLGCGIESVVAALQAGRSGVAPIRRFGTDGARAKSAALIEDFDPRQAIPTLDLRRMDRVMQFAVVAAHHALADARLPRALPRERIGLVLGTSRGAVTSFEKYLESVRGGAWHRASPIYFPNLVMSSIGGQVSRALDVQGACSTIVDGIGCGLNALIHGAELLRQSDDQDALVVLASDEVGEMFFRLSDRLGRLSLEIPARAAMRPYHPAAAGFALGEGAVALVLERSADARTRSARVHAELAGAGLTHDGGTYLGAEPDGAEMTRAMRLALCESGIDAGGLDVIYGHGRSMPAYDAREVRAFARLLEGRCVPVSCVLGNTGVAEASCGLFTVAAAALGLERDLAWPIVGDEIPSPQLRFIQHLPRRGRYRHALVAGSTDSGNNTAVVLRAAHSEGVAC